MKKKILTFGLVGSLLMSGVSFAENLQSIPEMKKVEISKTLENPSRGEVKVSDEILPVERLYNAKIRLPKFSGLSDKIFEEELNYIIKLNAEKDLKAFKEELEKIDGPAFENGQLEIDYEVKSEGEIISLEVSKYSTLKSEANGNTRVDYYNIDRINNRNIGLKDLFKEDTDFKSVINEQILEEVNSNKEDYFQEEGKFKSIGESQKFYINKNGEIVIVFEKYEIAPGSKGSIEIPIENDRIKDLRIDLKEGEKAPVSGKILSSKDDINVRIPVINCLRDLKFQEDLNREFEELAKKSIEEFKLEDSKVKTEDNIRSEMEVSYEIKHEGEVLSLLISDFRYIKGNANPEYVEYYYNIDMVNDRILDLKDFFKDKVDYKKEIDAFINEEIAKKKDDYFQEEGKFEGIKEDQKFYINKDGEIVIVFDKYEIAPGSTGRPEFVIKNSRFKNSIKDFKDAQVVKAFDMVKLNGKDLKLNDKIFKNKKGSLMLPLVEIAEGMDYKISWDGKNSVTKLEKGVVQVTASLKENQYSFSRALVILDEGAVLKDGKTYVPAEFFEKVLKLESSIDKNGVLNIKY